MSLRTLAAAVALALPAAAAAYSLRPAGTPATVARSTLSVTPTIAWNRIGTRPGRRAESWTLDGLPLNDLTFYGAIPDGKTLFNEVNKAETPLPRFQATMLAPDVAQLFEGSYRVALATSLFTVDRVEPIAFAGHPGFRFDYTFAVQGEEVRRHGEATGAIVAGKLYLITYEAPAIHYFDRNLADYRALVAGARIG